LECWLAFYQSSHGRQATAEKFNLQWRQGAVKKRCPKLKKYIFLGIAVTITWAMRHAFCRAFLHVSWGTIDHSNDGSSRLQPLGNHSFALARFIWRTPPKINLPWICACVCVYMHVCGCGCVGVCFLTRKSQRFDLWPLNRQKKIPRKNIPPSSRCLARRSQRFLAASVSPK